MTTDDRPYDPSMAAADALRALGHVPGPQPIRQLRQVGADALEDIHQSAAEEPAASGPAALAHVRLLEAAVAALGGLVESDLDDMEQQHLAAVFGLDGTGEAS
ncbi:hypothetical protein ACFTY8_19455 [Streptomyces mirabilis]|uniref:hypothetical protein n=1 Tax=Streptomyces mirabilis TaxID=68239 RepID=UPI0036349C17